jgi:hypothetical protein
MASFVQAGFPALRSAHYPASIRFESAAGSAKEVRPGFDGTRGLSTMLLAAMVSALLVVADQLMNTWADGHLMVAWVALWLVGFAAIAIFADAARRFASTVVSALNAWSVRLANARSDQRLWALAQTDPRVMAELTAAMTRNER